MTDETELHRAVERLTSTIEKLEARMVLQAVYLADKEAAAERYASLLTRLTDAERDGRDAVERLEKKVDADIADRKADRRLIYGAFFTVVGSVILQIYAQATGVS